MDRSLHENIAADGGVRLRSWKPPQSTTVTVSKVGAVALPVCRCNTEGSAQLGDYTAFVPCQDMFLSDPCADGILRSNLECLAGGASRDELRAYPKSLRVFLFHRYLRVGVLGRALQLLDMLYRYSAVYSEMAQKRWRRSPISAVNQSARAASRRAVVRRRFTYIRHTHCPDAFRRVQSPKGMLWGPTAVDKGRKIPKVPNRQFASSSIRVLGSCWPHFCRRWLCTRASQQVPGPRRNCVMYTSRPRRRSASEACSASTLR